MKGAGLQCVMSLLEESRLQLYKLTQQTYVWQQMRLRHHSGGQ